jgi:hypothetical protein
LRRFGNPEKLRNINTPAFYDLFPSYANPRVKSLRRCGSCQQGADEAVEVACRHTPATIPIVVIACCSSKSAASSNASSRFENAPPVPFATGCLALVEEQIPTEVQIGGQA